MNNNIEYFIDKLNDIYNKIVDKSYICIVREKEDYSPPQFLVCKNINNNKLIFIDKYQYEMLNFLNCMCKKEDFDKKFYSYEYPSKMINLTSNLIEIHGAFIKNKDSYSNYGNFLLKLENEDNLNEIFSDESFFIDCVLHDKYELKPVYIMNSFWKTIIKINDMFLNCNKKIKITNDNRYIYGIYTEKNKKNLNLLFVVSNPGYIKYHGNFTNELLDKYYKTIVENIINNEIPFDYEIINLTSKTIQSNNTIYTDINQLPTYSELLEFINKYYPICCYEYNR